MHHNFDAGICRFETVRKRSSAQLGRLMARDHIVLGLSAALSRVDAIVRVVKESVDSAAARESLTSAAFGFSTEQVRACG